jgi:HK97 family phage prohead protease
MIVTKAVALVDTVETDDPNGAFEVILSAATLDRDGEVIDKGAFDPLPDHIPFDIDHGMTVATTVGSGTPYYAEDGTLRVKGTFASTSLAQEVRTLVSEGHVRTTSVTFMSADRAADEKGVQHIKTAELLNGTFTPVPSNREAVVLSAKGLNAALEEKVGARNSATDASMIQSAHDSMVALGADCSGAAKSAPRGEFKSVAGSLEETQDRVRDALNDAYGATAYVWLRATLPGSCVYEIDATDGSECETYQESFTDDGSVVTLSGDQALVDLTEVITPDADADREKSADDTADTAALAAEPTVKSTDDEAVEAALLSLQENAAQLAFGG